MSDQDLDIPDCKLVIFVEFHGFHSLEIMYENSLKDYFMDFD
jgi:hypothetical protein